jgi:hypothetical protein
MMQTHDLKEGQSEMMLPNHVMTVSTLTMLYKHQSRPTDQSGLSKEKPKDKGTPRPSNQKYCRTNQADQSIKFHIESCLEMHHVQVTSSATRKLELKWQRSHNMFFIFYSHYHYDPFPHTLYHGRYLSQASPCAGQG